MIRRSLEAEGIPSKEIAFIHNFQKNEQKQRLFRQMREGQVRVLLGSTNKLGVGVNVQDRLAAVHHVDVPWRPRDVEQREGRIIRAGNEVYGPKFDDDGNMIEKGRGVKIYKYIQQGSFDEFMWQAVQAKAAGIKAITKRNVTARQSDDLDEFVLSAAEAKALASGDPRAVELVTLETQLAGMRLDRAAYESQRANAQAQIGTLTNRVNVLGQQLPTFERDAAHAKRALEAEFSARDDDGRAFDKRADADKDFKAKLARVRFGEEIPLGTYKGFKLHGKNRDTGYQVIIESTATGQKYVSSSFDNPANTNLLSRVDNVITAMESAHEEKAQQLASAEASLKSYRNQLEKPYDQLPELRRLERRVSELKIAVQGGDDSQPRPQGETVNFSQEGMVQEDIEQASDEDLAEAQQRVLAQAMERRVQDRTYQMPTGAAFDSLVSEAVQDILDERRRDTGVDSQVDPEVREDLPASIPNDLQERAAAAVEEAYDIDPGQVADLVETSRRESLAPAEVDDVVERVAERLQADVDDGEAPATGPKVTVVSLEDVDALLQEEMKDEGLEEGVIPQYADTEYDEADDAALDEYESDAHLDTGGTMVQESPAPAPTTRDLDESLAVLPEWLDRDTALQNALANSGEQNSRIEFERAMERAVADNVKTDTMLYRSYMEDPEFREDLNERLFRERMPAPAEEPEAPPAEVEPAVALATEESPPVEPEADAEPFDPSAPNPYYYRETDVDTGEAIIHVEAPSMEEAEEIVSDMLDSPDAAEETPLARRRLVTDPLDEELGVDLEDPAERDLAASESLENMSEDIRETHDVLQERMGHFLDDYELTVLARRLGADASPEALDLEEAKLLRQHALNEGQQDMFGATADEPDAFVPPEPDETAPAPVESPPEVAVESGDSQSDVLPSFVTAQYRKPKKPRQSREKSQAEAEPDPAPEAVAEAEAAAAVEPKPETLPDLVPIEEPPTEKTAKGKKPKEKKAKAMSLAKARNIMEDVAEYGEADIKEWYAEKGYDGDALIAEAREIMAFPPLDTKKSPGQVYPTQEVHHAHPRGKQTQPGRRHAAGNPAGAG